MSKATKRKHVTKEILEEYYVPEEDETIAKVSASHSVSGEFFLFP